MITFDQKLVEFLNDWTIGEHNWPIGNLVLCIIALVLCVVLVGAVGIEREKRGRSAGLRTHLLVGVGSCILMIISVYGDIYDFVTIRRKRKKVGLGLVYMDIRMGIPTHR